MRPLLVALLFSATALALAPPSAGVEAAQSSHTAHVSTQVVADPDFNNDGFADLAVGVTNENVGSIADAGSAHVFYGSAAGLQATSPDDQVWTEDSPDVLGSAEIGDFFGSDMAAGDFNNDTFADLAIGVTGENLGTKADAGQVHVLYGSAAGLQATSPDDQLLDEDQPGVLGVAEAGDFFGGGMSAGDFNNDGFADLAVGVPGENVGTIDDAGSTHLFYGSAAGLQATAPEDQVWTEDSPDVLGSAEAGDFFGGSRSGDFNNDGFADLAVEVPGENVGTIVDAGSVHVFYGSAAGLQATLPDDQVWQENTAGVLGAAERGDAFGFTLGTGDFNNDSFTDLAVGVLFENVGSIVDAGSAHVFYGSAAGIQATSPDDQVWTEDSPDVLGKAEWADLFGATRSVGDFNNDGFADLAVGVPGENVGNIVDAGSVHVFYGSAAGLQASSPDDQVWTQDSSGVLDSAEAGDLVGGNRAVDDYNNDGFADLVVGAQGENVGTIVDAGAVNVLYGSAAGLQATSPDDQFWHENSPGVLGAAEKEDFFGGPVV